MNQELHDSQFLVICKCIDQFNCSICGLMLFIESKLRSLIVAFSF